MSVILDEIQQRANVTQIQINILLPISQISFESFVSYTNNKNILVSFFDRTFSSDSLVFIFEEKYVAILDKKPASEFVREDVDHNLLRFSSVLHFRAGQLMIRK